MVYLNAHYSAPGARDAWVNEVSVNIFQQLDIKNKTLVQLGRLGIEPLTG